MNLPPIPQSQKNRVRVNALRAWRSTLGDGLNAKVAAERSNERDIGVAWLMDANALAGDLIDYWEENAIAEPSATFVAGEPGMQDWDE